VRDSQRRNLSYLSVTGSSLAFLFINAALLLLVSRRWAPLPLLLGTCYMTLGQGFELGPFNFTFIRILVTVGVLRVVTRREGPAGGMIGLDWLMAVWAVWAIISSSFHHPFSEALVFRLGLVFNACGIYFLLRCLCRSLDEIFFLCRMVAIVLAPVAAAMLAERVVVYNFFSVLGGVPEIPAIREGVVRAQGPFAHPILAGTVGAVCLPLAIALWQKHRKAAILGIMSCLVMVLASGSSGPFLSVFVGVGALFMWRYRHRMRLVRWAAVAAYLIMDLIMKAPAYYLIARIGASGTGWHRARLIESSIEHLNEWWLAGTGYTRHWMPTGVSYSPDQTDITNHYIKLGVLGGLPLMFLFIATLARAFAYVGHLVHGTSDMTQGERFAVWALGASLFANAVSCISVSYFDQSFMFLYLTLAAITSLRSMSLAGEPGRNLLHSQEPAVQLGWERS
jgi:hypothetical protein